MKTPYWLPCAALVVLSLGADSCDSYSDLVADSLPSASFISAGLNITESSGEQFVAIRLDKPVRSDGHVVVKVVGQGELPISTTPAIKQGIIKVPINAGRALVNIQVVPIDNNKLDGLRNVSLSVLAVDGAYNAGNQDLAQISIADDESPARVEFSGREGSFGENDTDGMQVDLRFSAPAPAAGILIVEARTDCRYSTDFFTVPSLVNGKLYLPVAEGQSTVGVKVFSINDAVKRADRHITFQVLDAAGGVMIDGSAGYFQLWIVEDDVNAALAPLAPSVASEK